VSRIVFLWEFLHVRMLFSGSTIASAGYAYLSFAGRDYDYQTLNLTFTVNVVKFGLIIGISEVSQAVRSLLYPCSLVTETLFSIVSRILSNLPSPFRQEIEFIRPMVEE
jgi:hypothetical protein